MKPLDDDQRRQAIDPARSCIIQAPAGSGKTELLTQRYLRLLTRVDSPEEIIAITFTRKAAAEMQSRILAALQAVNTGRQPESDHQRQTRELAHAVLQRDTQQDWGLRGNPARLRIQTIDSLCASLARQMPMLSGLGAQPAIVDDAEPLYEQAAMQTLAELESGEAYANAIAGLLLHLDNDLPRIKTLLAEMLRKRDQWLRPVTQGHDRAVLEQALKNAIEAQLARLTRLFPPDVEAELCSILRFAACNLKQANTSHALIQYATITTLPGDRAEDLVRWSGIVELLLTGENNWRRSFNKNNGFPAPSERHQDSEERARMKDRIASVITQLKQCEGLQDQLAEIKALPAAAYADQEWEAVQALCVCLKLAAAQLRLCFAEHNQIDYIGMAQAALDALGEEDAPTDLALHLDYQIKHLLVDEFQDISMNQYRLITQLTETWTQDDDRSLFLVGDPMQSIYRFRQAEVGLFIHTFQQQRLGQIPLTPLRLSVNFRSLPGIIDWINTHFAAILPEQDDMATGAVRYTPSTAQAQADASAVHLYPLFDAVDLPAARQVKHREAQRVQNIVAAIRRDTPQARIAILVRSRTHLHELVPLLRKQHIPFQAIEIEALGQRPAIQDILALTRAYTHPADRTAWLAVLRAPWCGLTLNELHSLVHQDSSSTLWPAITDSARQKKLNRHAAKRLQGLIACFSDAFHSQQRRPLRNIIETLWLRLGGPATLTTENDLDNINTYFELLEQFDRGGEIHTPQQFMDKVQQLYAAPESQAGEALQIMTIHKAKGLEFDHVIVPGLGRGQKRGQTELLKWMVQPSPNSDNDLLLAPIKEAGQKQAAIYQYIHHIEQKKQRHEEIRLLYVAGTRARQALHLVGHARLKQDEDANRHCEVAANALLQHLWPVLQPEYAAAMPEKIEADATDGIPLAHYALRRLHRNWRAPLPEAPLDWANKQHLAQTEPDYAAVEYKWAGETIKHIGLVVHRFLKQIAEEGAATWNAARIQQNHSRFAAMLHQLGVPDDETGWAGGQIAEALNKILQDERGQWLLINHQQQQNEYPLSGVFQGRLINIIIDRTFIDEAGVRWIIDYKTSRHEGPDLETFLDHEQERYRGQLEKYAGLIQTMDAGPIRLGLYFPLLQGWREWGRSE